MNARKIHIIAIVLFVLLSASIDIYGQSELEMVLQSILEDEDNERVAELTDQLESLHMNPIDLNNKTDIDRLDQLEIITAFQREEIKAYARSYAPIRTFNELRGLAGIDEGTMKLLELFTILGTGTKTTASLFDGKNEFIARYQSVLQKSKGYIERDDGSTPYIGDKNKYYIRYRFDGSRMRFGIVGDKDPGESFFDGENKAGFDFYSAHMQYNMQGFVRQINLGDFRVNYGQGLSSYNGFGIGKSSQPTNLMKANRGISAFASADESNFYRGAAVSFAKGKISGSIFGSYDKKDASLSANSEYINTIRRTGYHRTEGEIQGKDKLAETSFGANVSLTINRLRIGINSINHLLDKSLIKGSQLYQLYELEGRSLKILSSDYQWSFNKVILFGELANSIETGGLAYVGGINLKSGRNSEFAFIYRNYAKEFHNLYGGGFSESSQDNDERGLYIGFESQPIAKLDLRSYIDFYKFNAIKYRTIAPTNGCDFMAELEYNYNYKLSFTLRSKYEATERKSLQDERHYLQKPFNTGYTRLYASYSPCEQVVLRSRVDYAYTEFGEKSSGWYFGQDVNISLLGETLKWWNRAAWFNTNGSNLQIYAYENDVLYSYSVPTLSGKGWRFYTMLKLEFGRHLRFWLRYSRIQMSDDENIGSQYNEIPKKYRDEVKLQMQVKF
ncbi:MAG: hypothetical protein ACK5L5_06625 [Bacteroidales bacterium]